jgi:hypothetical protein
VDVVWYVFMWAVIFTVHCVSLPVLSHG